MGILSLFRPKIEIRADPGTVEISDPLLRAMLGGGEVTKEMALQVPTVSGGIDLIAGIIAGTPIKLYRETEGRAQEIRDDPRLRLLNDDTGDTLDANQFWRAMIRDYYTGKGGYAYIHRERGEFRSLHYVDEGQISILKNVDPIFKSFAIQVAGQQYEPFRFLKLLRNTRDGATGVPITQESAKLIEVAYQSLCFEGYMVKKGGNKKGFLKSEKSLTQEAMDKLKAAFAKMYSNSSDNVVVLNRGLDFVESSNTAVEMQVNENKAANAAEFAKIFHISPEAMAGGSQDTAALAKLAAIPLMNAIQCALNRDLLLESEKGSLYWAFDTKELLKGDMKSRFEAYRTALEANFMQPDEVRFAEDLAPLGLNWIRLGLQDVLYDPKTGQVYTPNTNQTAVMGQKALPEAAGGGKMEEAEATADEERANNYIQLKNGKMNGSRPNAGNSKSGKSSRPKLGKKEHARVTSAILTDHPNYQPGNIYGKFHGKHYYQFTVNGPGDYSFHRKLKIVGNEQLIRMLEQEELE